MRQFTKIEKEAPIDFENFRIHMQREMILRKLKEGGYRITKQRIAVIDIILENDCGSCKEILYKTSKINKKIGIQQRRRRFEHFHRGDGVVVGDGLCLTHSRAGGYL